MSNPTVNSAGIILRTSAGIPANACAGCPNTILATFSGVNPGGCFSRMGHSDVVSAFAVNSSYCLTKVSGMAASPMCSYAYSDTDPATTIATYFNSAICAGAPTTVVPGVVLLLTYVSPGVYTFFASGQAGAPYTLFAAHVSSVAMPVTVNSVLVAQGPGNPSPAAGFEAIAFGGNVTLTPNGC